MLYAELLCHYFRYYAFSVYVTYDETRGIYIAPIISQYAIFRAIYQITMIWEAHKIFYHAREIKDV